MTRARLLSDRGALSLDGRAILYWIRLSERERERSPMGPPAAAMRRLLEQVDRQAGGQARALHPSLEARRAEILEECKKRTASNDARFVARGGGA